MLLFIHCKRDTNGNPLPENVTSKIDAFKTKKEKTIDVWWLHDDGGNLLNKANCQMDFLYKWALPNIQDSHCYFRTSLKRELTGRHVNCGSSAHRPIEKSGRRIQEVMLTIWLFSISHMLSLVNISDVIETECQHYWQNFALNIPI